MDKLTQNWHKTIVSRAEKKLNRPLSIEEKAFIESRQGYIALEIIEDTVEALSGDSLVEYLSSEHGDNGEE